jgi:deoxyribodipyrimidine photo-lyase
VTRALVLFTRDLRVRDQPALAAAVREADTIVPAFVLDRQLLAGGCGAPNRLAFLLDSLKDLDRSLRQRGGQLVVREGDVVAEALRLAAQWELSAIYMSADSTPYAQRRQRRLAAACQRARIELRTYPGITVLAPGQLTPTGGDHYRVFTPYWRVWSRQHPRPLLATPRRISTPPGLLDAIPLACQPDVRAALLGSGRATLAGAGARRRERRARAAHALARPRVGQL